MKERKWYQKISNWIFILLVMILLPILLINIYIMIQANNNNDKVPSVFGYKPFIVLSGSMETKIHVGDLIITKEIDPESLKVEDIIAFRDQENTVTTHRIIDIVEKDGTTYFITKGDNNNTQDQNLVEYKDVEGLYITRIPGIGNMLNELSKPTTVVIVGLGLTIIFILAFQINNSKYKDQEKQEFLEYKKMKEKEEKEKEEVKEEKTAKSSKKTTSKKTAVKKEESTPKKKSSKTTQSKTSAKSTKSKKVVSKNTK